MPRTGTPTPSSANMARPAWTARLEPATINESVYGSSTVVLYAARHQLPVPRLARWLLTLGIVATLAANMARGWSHGPARPPHRRDQVPRHASWPARDLHRRDGARPTGRVTAQCRKTAATGQRPSTLRPLTLPDGVGRPECGATFTASAPARPGAVGGTFAENDG
jgi:hypothetical protein